MSSPSPRRGDDTQSTSTSPTYEAEYISPAPWAQDGYGNPFVESYDFATNVHPMHTPSPHFLESSMHPAHTPSPTVLDPSAAYALTEYRGSISPTSESSFPSEPMVFAPGPYDSGFPQVDRRLSSATDLSETNWSPSANTNYLQAPPSASFPADLSLQQPGYISTPYPPQHALGMSYDVQSPPPSGFTFRSPIGPSRPVNMQSKEASPPRPTLSYNEQVTRFKNIPAQAVGPDNIALFIPQRIYRPHTSADRKRYVDDAQLEEPIIFHCERPNEWGIPLVDALRQRNSRLVDRDGVMFTDRGPSISIRLEWIGYTSWSRQIPTRDFKTPPGPITRAKLAKNVAKNIERFLTSPPSTDEEVDPRWRVGGKGGIKLDDLILVSLHHVSMGSWQPQLRLRAPR